MTPLFLGLTYWCYRYSLHYRLFISWYSDLPFLIQYNVLVMPVVKGYLHFIRCLFIDLCLLLLIPWYHTPFYINGGDIILSYHLLFIMTTYSVTALSIILFVSVTSPCLTMHPSIPYLLKWCRRHCVHWCRRYYTVMLRQWLPTMTSVFSLMMLTVTFNYCLLFIHLVMLFRDYDVVTVYCLETCYGDLNIFCDAIRDATLRYSRCDGVFSRYDPSTVHFWCVSLTCSATLPYCLIPRTDSLFLHPYRNRCGDVPR